MPIDGTDCKNIVGYIEEICKTNGLINRMKHNEKEIRIFHKFDDKDIIKTINETILKTLEVAGHPFKIKKGDNMTILCQKNTPAAST